MIEILAGISTLLSRNVGHLIYVPKENNFLLYSQERAEKKNFTNPCPGED